jgi:hypothetical protein
MAGLAVSGTDSARTPVLGCTVGAPPRPHARQPECHWSPWLGESAFMDASALTQRLRSETGCAGRPRRWTGVRAVKGLSSTNAAASSGRLAARTAIYRARLVVGFGKAGEPSVWPGPLHRKHGVVRLFRLSGSASSTFTAL